MQIQTQRLHGMDALRGIAMFLGIVLHGIIPYRAYSNANWPSDTAFHFIGMDLFYLWIHSFRMQLFYIVAGFFAYFLYKRIGEKAFIRHRIKRILIPFIISLIIIVPLSAAPFLYYNFLAYGSTGGNATQYVLKHLLSWNGMFHLWFLYYLLMFYAIMILALHILKLPLPAPLKIFLRRCCSYRLTSFKNLVLLSIPLTLILFLSHEVEIEAYSGIYPRVSMLCYYGFFFLLGWMLYTQADNLKDTGANTWPCLIVGTLLVPLVLWLILFVKPGAAISFPLLLSAKFISAFQTLMLVFGMLGLFMKYLNRESKTIRYLSDSSYWFYLVHVPILVSLQILFMSGGIPGFLRWIIALTITTVISLLSYELFVRYTFIGTMLNGPKKRIPRSRAALSNA